MLTVKNLSKSYGQLKVIDQINFTVNKGEVISIVGASGAGKSTLLQILGTLDNPDEGKLLVEGTEVNQLDAKSLAKFRNEEIGFVFQFHHLLPEFTALENVCFPGMIGKRDRVVVEASAKELLTILGLEDRMQHAPNQLSGGEQQRVAVARALINNPSIVLADEPSGNLDAKSSKELHQLFFDLRDQFQQTFIIVTHNQDLAKMADRMLTIKEGKIIEG